MVIHIILIENTFGVETIINFDALVFEDLLVILRRKLIIDLAFGSDHRRQHVKVESIISGALNELVDARVEDTEVYMQIAQH